MRIRRADPVDRGEFAATMAERERRPVDDRPAEPLCVDGEMRGEDTQRAALSADWDEAKRQVQIARRSGRTTSGPAERRLAPRREVSGRNRTSTSDPSATPRSEGPATARQLNDRPLFVEDYDIPADTDVPPVRPITEAEQAQLAEFEARDHERRELRDGIYRQLRNDAQACARSMYYSRQLDSPEEWEAAVLKALKDYRSGRALMDQLGADRLLDAPTAGMLLAIRRGLIEETMRLRPASWC
jgi:hypothetical protein